MSSYKANVICNWFDGDKFYHSLSNTKITREKTWDGDEYVAEFGKDEIRMSFNADANEFDFVVDLGCFCSKQAEGTDPSRRILAVTEPSTWLGLSEERLEEISSFYPTRILGWHEALKGLKQYVFWNATTKWVGDDVPREKKFGVSGFISNKMRKGGQGYELRYEVILNQGEIKVPSLIYNFTGMWQGEKLEYPVPKKDIGMGHMFHLAIENVCEPGNFTEKLIDCFASRVVPLYYGAPDIGDFFDTTGIIVLDPKRWLTQINCLTEQDFLSRIEVLEKNYKASKKYWSVVQGLAEAIWQRSKE